MFTFSYYDIHSITHLPHSSFIIHHYKGVAPTDYRTFMHVIQTRLIASLHGGNLLLQRRLQNVSTSYAALSNFHLALWTYLNPIYKQVTPTEL